MQVLVCLAAHPGRTVTKEEFMDRVWTGTVVSDDVLARCISELRKVFDDDPRSPSYIETIRKSGYRLIAPVAMPSDEADATPDSPPAAVVSGEAPAESYEPFEDEEEYFEGDGQSVEGDEEPGVPVIRGESSFEPHEPEGARGATEDVEALVSTSPALLPVHRELPALPSALPTQARARRRETLRWGGLALFVVVLGAVVGFFALRGDAAGPLETVPFTSFPGQEAEPALSPDGEQVAFTWEGADGGNADVYVKQAGAETPLQLTATPTDEWSPTWSPDGLRIAFVRALEGGGHAVVVVPAIGGSERTLVELEDREISGIAWSPDGATLALSAQAEPTAPFSLFLLSIQTLQMRRLTEPDLVEGGDVSPSFAPNGERVAFVRGTSRGGEDLFVVSVQGGEPEQLTRGEREIAGIDWTPDGQDLVFASRRREGAGLWRVAVAGGAPEWVATAGDGESVRQPSMARRSRRLTYEQRSADANIWAIRQGRFGRAPLIRSTRWDSNPQFAPDGKRIAFASDRTGSTEVWLVNDDGLNPIQLTDFGGPLVSMPRWSPDGRRLAFDARVDGNADIYLIDANGGEPVRLTEDDASDVAPSWSHDSTTVYFSSDRTGTWEVWRVPASGGRPARVTYHGGYNAFESPDGQMLYYAKKGEPGLWRRGADDEEETLVLGALEPFDWGNWAVTNEGIYFIRREAAGPTIRFYSFLSGWSTPIASLDDVPEQPSLAVSPDGQVLLYTHVDRNESDILLVEDFQ